MSLQQNLLLDHDSETIDYAGYNAATDALAYEDSSSTAASVYANIIAVKKGNEKKAKIKALVKALKSDSLKNWLKTRFKGSVIAYDGK